jgi:hypothetical protein
MAERERGEGAGAGGAAGARGGGKADVEGDSIRCRLRTSWELIDLLDEERKRGREMREAVAGGGRT